MTCLCFVLNIKFNSMDGENTLYDHLLNQNCSQNSANKIPKFPNFSNFSDFPHKKKPPNVPHELENVNFISNLLN